MSDCKNRKALKPLNQQATAAANKAQPSCSSDAERKNWMDAYISSGGPWECADPKEKTLGAIVVPCPAPPVKTTLVKFVTSIKAKVAGTKGARDATNVRPDNILKASGSSDESLAGNTPVILIRGCKEIELEALTTPANTSVTWSVKSNENTDAPPSITPFAGGTKAKLGTNVHGSFSVIAQLEASTIVWNVVFVWVRVVVSTSVIITQNNRYADQGSHPGLTIFRSGRFVVGQYAWRAKVKMEVLGGGNSKRIGTNKVKVHLLQNGITDTLTAHYTGLIPPGNGTALEVPLGGIPVLDANSVASPFLVMASVWRVTPAANNTYKREVWSADSPQGGFSGNHLNQLSWRINSITGINEFVAAIASVSDDAPHALMVHAKTKWTADYKGDVNAAGRYTPKGAKTTKQAKYELISQATGGQDAQEAGFETFPPLFNAGATITWTP